MQKKSKQSPQFWRGQKSALKRDKKVPQKGTKYEMKRVILLEIFDISATILMSHVWQTQEQL